jgi:tRNA threonylcarbamoyladenosine biosynthesis protein TsaB
MTLILNIETATTVCSVSLAQDGKTIAVREQNGAYSHAENLTVFIQDVFLKSDFKLKDVDAIAISMGPGSYTGLRIGVSVAKGLCYSLDKPLIAVNTLQHLALSVSLKKNSSLNQKNELFCPMIDARRMEVYYSIFDGANNEVVPIGAEIITENSFADLLKENNIYFFGNGTAKCKEMLSHHKNVFFIDDIALSANTMSSLSHDSFKNNLFEDVAHFEPFYLKDFLIKKSQL